MESLDVEVETSSFEVLVFVEVYGSEVYVQQSPKTQQNNNEICIETFSDHSG